MVLIPLPASRDRFAASARQAENAAVEAEALLSAAGGSTDGTRIAMHLNIIGAEELSASIRRSATASACSAPSSCLTDLAARPAKTRNTRSIAAAAGRGAVP